MTAVIAVAAVPAAPASAKLKLKKVGRFNAPTYVTSAPGTPGVLVVEQGGKVISAEGRRRRIFLDLSPIVRSGGEQGLLSIAFPADYGASGLFYAYYTNADGNIVIAEFRRASRFRADPAYHRQVLLVPHPNFSNHNGGQLQFGPDGQLYIGTGDGGGAGDSDNSAQTTDNLLGKILRIDPRQRGSSPYTTSNSNAFTAGPGRDEIYAIGLRNPFRFSFDRDKIVIGDVGQDRFEEIDYEAVVGANGANFGWNDFEGLSPFSGAIPPGPTRHDSPIHAYDHAGGRCSVIAGFVSHSKKLRSLRGKLVYGDFCDGQLRTLVPTLGGAHKIRRLGLNVPMLSSFGRATNGAIYAASHSGPVYRLRQAN
ncbi:MAG: sorbosone dehydrogenase family protein [Solirubrobacterales bacterium]